MSIQILEVSMVFTQTLGKINAKKLKKPKGKNKVGEIIKRNRDIKNEIDASVRAAKAITNQDRDRARQRAIIKAMRNPTFRGIVRIELTKLVRRSG
jgi:guanylate kinase